MTFLQIAILIFSAFALIRVAIRYRKKDISFREWLVWTVVWLTAGIAAALPQTTDQLARGLGLATGRGVDLVVYSAIPILFYIAFRLYTKVDRLQKDITKIVRSIAIDTVESKDKS